MQNQSQIISFYIQRLQKKAINLQNAFIVKFHQNWGLKESVCELVIQLGHLVHALSRDNQIIFRALQQPGRKKIQNIADEISDCLLSILSISVFANITADEIASIKCVVYPHKLNQNNLMLLLSILGSQLLDCYEIYSGLKPKFQRNERKCFISLWSTIFICITYIADRQQINIEKQFEYMVEEANAFLENIKE